MAPNARVLDLGCSQGLLAAPLAEKGCSVTGVDVIPPEFASKLLHSYHQADLRHLDEIRLDRAYDAVLLADEFSGFLSDQRKRLEAEVDQTLGIGKADELSRADLDRIKEERLALLNALVRRDILEYLYLLESWYRDQLIVAATGTTDQVWNLDQTKRLEGAATTKSGDSTWSSTCNCNSGAMFPRRM